MIRFVCLITLIFITVNTFVYALPSSRLKTSLDFPSKYDLSKEYSDEFLMNKNSPHDIGESFSIAFEQRVLKRKSDKKVGLYLGAEIMMGKSADIIMAFHSAYIMPVIS